MDNKGKQFLIDACIEAKDWAMQFDTLAEAWEVCHRPDWMCWALNKLNYDDSVALRRFACWSVRNTPLHDGRMVWDLLTDERSRHAVEVAERFVNGEATAEELSAARGAAWSAADAAWSAAWSAADAAWRAARGAARSAADAADAADAAWSAARSAQANALREYIDNPFK